MAFVPYGQRLANRVKTILDNAKDRADLEEKIILMVKDENRQSYINGLKNAKDKVVTKKSSAQSEQTEQGRINKLFGKPEQ
jgi:C4-type Zn-finger protein